MNKPYFIFMLVIIASVPCAAGWFSSDERDVCYNWNGDREPCTRSSLRRESLLAGQFDSFYGSRDHSFVGSYGQGLVLSTVRSHNTVRFLFGGQGSYSSAKAYINDVTHNATMMSLDLFMGMSIKPYNNTTLMPVIELSVLAGLKSIEFSNPPTGVEEKNLQPSYGGKLSIGIDFKIGQRTALRPAVDYQVIRVPGIIDDENFVLDSLGFSLGLVFL